MNQRNLTLAHRFMLTSVAVLALGMFGVGWWVSRQIETGVTNGTAETTALYMQSVVAPQVQELAGGAAVTDAHIAALSGLLRDTPLGTQIVAFKVWGPGGRVIYSTDPAVTGRVFPVTASQARAWRGGIASGITDLTKEENVDERRQFQRLLETYAPIRHLGTGQIIAVAEFYQVVDHIQDEINGAKVRSWLVVSGAATMMYLLLAGFVQRASDTIARQEVALREQVAHLTDVLSQNAALHERVRGAVARAASLNERFLRRISAELHDGPAQDLALALLRLDQVVGDAPNDSAELKVVLDALRRALQEVRTISAGLTLPQLNDLTPGDTARRAVQAHQRRTGTRVAIEVDGLPDQAPAAVKITLYRLIQEALNNAVRHAGGVGQRVVVRYAAGALHVEVRDGGPGIDPAAPADDESHLGLLGMRERAESLGGTFQVESAPGRGTTVRAVLPMAAPDPGGPPLAEDACYAPHAAGGGQPALALQEAAHG